MDLPDIDPAAHAIDSFAWGDRIALYLVPWDGKFLIWTVRTADQHAWATQEPTESAAREKMAAEFAWALFLDTEEDVARASAADPDGVTLYEAILADGGEAGIWLATQDRDGGDPDAEPACALAGFGDLDAAVEAFARSAEQAADRIAARPGVRYPGLIRAHLRDQAARARAGAARAVLGDAVRRDAERLRAGRAVRGAAHTLGVSREFLYRVMGGGEWAWKGAGAGVPPLAPPPPPPAEPAAVPALDWLVRVNLGIRADTLVRVLEVAREVLAVIDLPVPRGLAAVPHGTGTWIVQAELDLSGTEFEPDNAETRLSRATWNLDGVPWTGSAVRDELMGVRRWPGSFFSEDPDALFPIPDVIAIEITAVGKPQEAAGPTDQESRSTGR